MPEDESDEYVNYNEMNYGGYMWVPGSSSSSSDEKSGSGNRTGHGHSHMMHKIK